MDNRVDSWDAFKSAPFFRYSPHHVTFYSLNQLYFQWNSQILSQSSLGACFHARHTTFYQNVHSNTFDIKNPCHFLPCINIKRKLCFNVCLWLLCKTTNSVLVMQLMNTCRQPKSTASKSCPCIFLKQQQKSISTEKAPFKFSSLFPVQRISTEQ